MRPFIKLFSISSTVVLTTLILFSSCFKENSTGRNKRADIYNDVSYGSNTDINGKPLDLKLDVYVPKGASSTQTFPMILYVHGGGFVDGDKSDASSLMLKFVDSGYVAVSINYRLSETDNGNACDADTTQTKHTTYMAVQDTKAALRYMVANASSYHVDVSKIFLSGNSAGAVTVLNTAYISQTDYEIMLPGIGNELGGLDNASNSLTNTFSIKGVAANSGCLPDPAYITTSNAIPMILFHGGKDKIIPVDKGHTYDCPHTEFVYGSQSLYERASGLESAVIAHIDPTGDHLPYNSDFLAVNESCFFRSVLNKVPENGYYTGGESSCK